MIAFLLAAAAAIPTPTPAPLGAKAAEARKAYAIAKPYEDGLRYANGDRTKEVHDCAELDAALAAGMTNASQARPDFEVGARLEAVCSELALLSRAKPAGKSYVKDFRLDRDAASQLPPCFDQMNEGGMLTLGAALAKTGTSWKAITPDLQVVEAAPATLTVKGTTKLALVARADLDGDRVEDLVIEAEEHADGGTANAIWWVALTRKAGDPILRVIRDSSGVCAPTVDAAFSDCSGDRVDQAIAQAASSKDPYGSLVKFRSSCKAAIPAPFRDRLAAAIANAAHAKGDDDACRKALEGTGDDDDVYAPDVGAALETARTACPPFH